MSWIFGVLGEIANINPGELQQLHGKPLVKHQTSNFYIAAGGIKETCFYKFHPDLNQGWLVCGIGIDFKNESFHLMTEADWTDFFNHFSPDNLKKLNGHFAIVKWMDDKIECYTDQLGFRNLYLTNINQQYTFFSTRLDWVARINPDSNIDYEIFGSQWLLINSLSPESPIKNISRLSPNGYATCTSKSIKYRNTLWHPDFNREVPHLDHIDIIRELTLFPLKEEYQVSLALSGGLDSRVLLSIFLSSGMKNWFTHSLHGSKHPDSQIAGKISRELQLENIVLNDELPEKNNIQMLINELVGYTNAVFPLSYVVELDYYKKLYGRNKILIDGGMGEIARHRFLVRSLIRGKKIFQQRILKSIRSAMFLEKAPIFNEDALKVMNQGIFDQLNQLLEEMPAIDDFGFEN